MTQYSIRHSTSCRGETPHGGPSGATPLRSAMGNEQSTARDGSYIDDFPYPVSQPIDGSAAAGSAGDGENGFEADAARPPPPMEESAGEGDLLTEEERVMMMELREMTAQHIGCDGAGSSDSGGVNVVDP